MQKNSNTHGGHFCNLVMYNIFQEPLSWLVGSEVVVVDPPRKGLDPSLISALQAIRSAERKAMTLER